MELLQLIFYFLIVLVFYAYLGYGIVLFLLVTFKRNIVGKNTEKGLECLPVTVLIAAYNEEDFIEKKLLNTLQQNYAEEKLNVIVVTDGSDDQTYEIAKKFPSIRLLHQSERRGKIDAINRAMQEVETEIVVFTDANTLLNQDAIRQLLKFFGDDRTGAVAGEKRVITQLKDSASASGEGFYWKYESKLKEWDSELNTVVGAAGELYAIRTKLFEEVPEDTLIEDFYLTLRIARKGFKVKYAPKAFAMEEPSDSSKEELKRKIRIAAGGIQSIIRLAPLLNVFKYGILSFQYISHRVLRWTLAPLALPLIFLINIYLAKTSGYVFQMFLVLQVVFYLMALVGYFLKRKKIKWKLFFIPYYFCMMNYAVYVGAFRYFTGKQSVVWERAKRREG